VTSRQALRMQPGIAPGGDLKGQVIVLAVVLANEDLLTRRGLERKGPWRLFLAPFFLSTLLARFHVPGLDQLFADLLQ